MVDGSRVDLDPAIIPADQPFIFAAWWVKWSGPRTRAEARASSEAEIGQARDNSKAGLAIFLSKMWIPSRASQDLVGAVK